MTEEQAISTAKKKEGILVCFLIWHPEKPSTCIMRRRAGGVTYRPVSDLRHRKKAVDAKQLGGSTLAEERPSAVRSLKTQGL